MRRFVWLVVLWLGLGAPCAAAPLEAYGRLPAIEAIDISPDGQMIAAVATDGDERVVSVSRISDGALIARGRAGELKVRDVNWAGSHHVIIEASKNDRPEDYLPRSEYLRIFDLDVTTGKLRQLLTEGRDGRNIVYSATVREVDGRPIAILVGPAFHGLREAPTTFFRFDLDQGGPAKAIAAEVANTSDWVLDARGEPVAQASYEEQQRRWTLRIRQGGAWRVSKSIVADVERPSVAGLGRKADSVLVETTDDQTAHFQEVSLSDGAWSEPLPLPDVEHLLRDRYSRLLTGYAARAADERAYVYFDPAEQKIWNAIVKAYPGQQVRPFARSADGMRRVVVVESPSDSPGFALVDLKTKHADWLGVDYPELHRADLGQVRPVAFRAKDGLPLTGYLTLPPARPEHELPLVVLPHGGPAARDFPGFDWWAQALASRGYAVLQVNFRGSDGFGTPFLKAGYGQWGRKMQTDLSDGVRYLAGQGVIDPKRVCIVGASYGGYAALAGAALDPGVYRCAASVGGLSDLRKFVDFSRGQRGPASQRYWLQFIGAQSPSDRVLGDISPVNLADRVEIPILLVHGKEDSVVPMAQSQMMADALKRAGKSVNLVLMDGEDHWLSRGQTRRQMLKAVVDFLERNNPPDGAPATAQGASQGKGGA